MKTDTADNILEAFLLDIKKIFIENEVRQAQLDFIKSLKKILSENTQISFIEAPTGIGKTIAYLYSILFYNKKAVISTKTKLLQDQLLNKDIPAIAKIFPVKAGVLKGRSNYACIQKCLDILSIYDIKDLQLWLNSTATGLLDELQTIDTELKNVITSDRVSCLEEKCIMYEKCFYQKSRIELDQYNILVLNHALLVKTLIQDPDFFKGFDILICDEAFEIDRIFTENSGISISYDSLMSYINYIEALIPEDIYKKHSLKQKVQICWNEICVSNIQNLENEVLSIERELGSIKKDFILDSVYEKVKRSFKGIKEFIEICKLIISEKNYIIEKSEKQILVLPVTLQFFIRNYLLPAFSNIVFISGTLFFKDNIPLKKTLSLKEEEITQFKILNGYDYKDQLKFIVIRGIGDSSGRKYTIDSFKLAQLVTYLERKMPDTSILVLFTSWDMLNQTAVYYRSLSDSNRLLVQGELTISDIQKRISDGSYTIFGNRAFWEGVDSGIASFGCLVVSKLPFEQPEDWYYKLKLNCLNVEDFFRDITLPHAVLTFKQGRGRLIRSQNHKGLLIVCDDRIVTAGYGRAFLDDMPEPRIIDFQKIISKMS